MDIVNVIDYINKELGYTLDTTIYSYIAEWQRWWEGKYKPFHVFKERQGEKLVDRDMYTLKMGKKVCEDWASILLNEKTKISIDDKSTEAYLLGDSSDGSSGLLSDLHFWTKANALVEKAFYSGTGAFVLRLDNMQVIGDEVVQDKDTTINLEYLPASSIIPLTVKHDRVIDIAFVSEVLSLGQSYIYLETHELTDNGYRITNRYFKDDKGALKEQPLPKGIAGVINTGSDIPLFALVRPNSVKTLDYGAGLGQSIYADAIDQLKAVDLAYNNFCRDFKLGGKKVFYNKDLVSFDSSGRTITPDDVAQQLFTVLGDGMGDQDQIKEYNPTLRVDENKNGIQFALDMLSFKCGLGTKHYQFNGNTGIVTATQYHGDKQDLIQHASKHSLIIEDAIHGIFKAILWAASDVLGISVDPDAVITVTPDDGYIVDPESQKEADKQDVRDGIMTKVEYRVKWYGETAEDAAAALSDNQNNSDPFFGGE